MDIFKCPWIESIIQELLANISGLQIVGSIQRVNDPKLIFGAACCDIVAFPIRIIYTIVQQMKQNGTRRRTALWKSAVSHYCGFGQTAAEKKIRSALQDALNGMA